MRTIRYHPLRIRLRLRPPPLSRQLCHGSLCQSNRRRHQRFRLPTRSHSRKWLLRIVPLLLSFGSLCQSKHRRSRPKIRNLRRRENKLLRAHLHLSLCSGSLWRRFSSLSLISTLASPPRSTLSLNKKLSSKLASKFRLTRLLRL